MLTTPTFFIITKLDFFLFFSVNSVIHENTVGTLTIVFFEITQLPTTVIYINGLMGSLLSMESFLNKLNDNYNN